ncbi:MAG: hypothetical protein AAF456_09545 [Planctomycetota bacterium]
MTRTTQLAFILLATFFAIDVTIAQTIVSTDSDARLVTEPSGARDDNNGGNTITGALIGVNTGSVDNFMLYEFSDLTALQGQTVVSATLEIDVHTGFSHSQHGSDQDVINLAEIALTNQGWVSGTGTISGSDTPADDGSVSFLNRIQYNGSGQTEPWLDENGQSVSNLTGALTQVSTASGWNQGSAPAFISFSIDAATAQRWVDDGLAGFVMSTTDNGDSRSRFNMMVDGARIVFDVISEPFEVMPFAISTTRGTYVSGGPSEIGSSDNDDYRINRNGFDVSSITEFECAGISPTQTPSSIDVVVEGAVFARSNVVQTIEAFDYDAGAWEQIDQRNAVRSPAPDSVVVVELTGDLTRFVEDSTGEIAMRVNFTSDNRRQNFSSNSDQCIWVISD